VEGEAKTDVESHPEHGSESVEHHEAPPRHTERPREGLADAVQTRHELRDQERTGAVARECFRSIPDTGVWLDRQPAHPLEDPLPPDAPDLVPDEIADHRARERQRRRERQTKAAVPGQGAGPEEKRLSRHRRHELFEDHSAKKSRIAVHPDEEI
jgi:hypothetical protein